MGRSIAYYRFYKLIGLEQFTGTEGAGGFAMIGIFIFFLIIVGVLSGSLAVILLKKAASKYPLRQLFFRRIFWEGVILFGISLLLYVVILQREELSVVYPLSSISYLITTMLSVKYLGEKMTIWKWIALAGVMMGVTLIAIGS